MQALRNPACGVGMLQTPPPEEAFVLQARSCWMSIWNSGTVPVICAIQKRCCAADTESPTSPCESFDNGSSIFSSSVLLHKCSSRHQHSQETQRGKTRGSQLQHLLYFHQGSSTCALPPLPAARQAFPGATSTHMAVRHPGVPGQLRDDSLSLKPACICSSVTSSRSLKPRPFPLLPRRKYPHYHPPPLSSPGLPSPAAKSQGLLPAVKTQKRVSTLTMSQQPPAPCSPKVPQAAKDTPAELLRAPDNNSCSASLGQRLPSPRKRHGTLTLAQLSCFPCKWPSRGTKQHPGSVQSHTTLAQSHEAMIWCCLYRQPGVRLNSKP